jgi:hypothetical protein
MFEKLYLKSHFERDKDGTFHVIYRGLEDPTQVMRSEGLTREKRKGIPTNLQYIIETFTLPFSVYDSGFNSRGEQKLEELKRLAERRAFSLDIEAFNQNRMPDPRKDPIVCIGYGNESSVKVLFNGEGKDFGGTLAGEEGTTKYNVFFGDERDILKMLKADSENTDNIFMVGHHNLSFDNRYIDERGKILGVEMGIRSYNLGNVFDRKSKARIFTRFVNIDPLPIIKDVLPSSRLEDMARMFGIKTKKMRIEELWRYYLDKDYLPIISHNINDVLITIRSFRHLLPALYNYGIHSIGTFEYSYTNPARNFALREYLNHLKKKGLTIEEILERVRLVLPDISFHPGSEKVVSKPEVNVESRKFKEAYLIDLSLCVAEKLKPQKESPYSSVLGELLESYRNANPDLLEGRLQQLVTAGMIDDIIIAMEKSPSYRELIGRTREDVKKELKGEIYSSRRFVIVREHRDTGICLPLENVLVFGNLFLGNYRGVPLGSVPKKQPRIPYNLHRALVQDLFDIVLNDSSGEMDEYERNIRERRATLDDLKIEAKGYDEPKLSRESKRKKFADEVMEDSGIRIEPKAIVYVAKTVGGFVTLEQLRSDENWSGMIDWEFYENSVGRLKRILVKSNPLTTFF